MKKRWLSLVLAVCMVLTLLPFRAHAEDIVKSGKCGANLTCTLDSNGLLTISGTGAMDDCWPNTPLWYANQNDIRSIVIEEGVTQLGYRAFENCRYLKDVRMPNTLTGIGGYAFSNCQYSLQSITIPKNVQSIGSCAFDNCWRLESIHVDPDNATFSSMDGVLFNKAKTQLIRYPDGKNDESYRIPNSVTKIKSSAFFRCNLKEVEIPDGVTEINSSTFWYCTSLSSVSIPVGVTTIWNGAFDDCNKLTDVYYSGSQEQWNSITIAGDNDPLLNATIHFNSSSQNTISLDVWSFANSSIDYKKGTSSGHEGYFISANDFSRLTSHLSNSDFSNLAFTGANESRFNIDGDLPTDILADKGNWGGSCYGMSSWVVLKYENILSPNRIDSAFDALQNVHFGDPAESAINYYHMQQYLPSVLNRFNAFMEQAQVMQIEDLITAGGSGHPFLISFQWYKTFNKDGSPDLESGAGHCVVGYGLESGGSWPQTVREISKTYHNRIIIYDCSNPSEGDKAYLYFNNTADDHTWCIPVWNIISSSSQERVYDYDNAQLISVETDLNCINAIDFSTGETNYDPVSDSAVMTAPANVAYQLTWNNQSYDIQGFDVAASENAQPLHVILSMNVSSDGETHSTSASICLPDHEASYTVQSQSGAYAIQYPNCQVMGETSSPGSISFSAEGKVHIQAETATNYRASVKDHASEAYTVQGKQGNDISLQTKDNGIVLTADSLENVEVSAPESETISISTTENSVFVKEEDKNLTAYTDTDGDGEYETSIDVTVVHTNPFTDVPDGKYYTDAVLWAVAHDPQITNGYADGTFRPDQVCTRAQVVTFLWRANGCPEPESAVNPFKDVSKSAYYYKAVLWAVENGITTGRTSNLFDPTGECTRAHVVTFLWRANGSPNPTSSSNPFTDVPAGKYYAKAVLWALENGVTTGKTANTFNPDGECTRAHVVTFLYRDMA